MSAASAKGVKSGAKKQLEPRFGTKRRALFDFLVENAGIIVPWADLLSLRGGSAGSLSQEIERLRSDYGLDVRSIKYGYHCLCGRWDGDRYIDFVAARHKEPPRV